MKSKTKAQDQAPYNKEQNSKTNIGYENTPKKAKDKGEEVASNDLKEQEKHPKHWKK